MADKVQYDENKLTLTVAKEHLTKGLNKLDASCKEMATMPYRLPIASRVKVASEVIKAVSIVSEKFQVSKCRNKTLALAFTVYICAC